MSGNSSLVWIGRILSLLVAAALIFSAVMKLQGAQQLQALEAAAQPGIEQEIPDSVKQLRDGLGHLGFPESKLFALGILELVCALIYLFPPTAVLGAILLAGYMGGAICLHWRMGDDVVVHIGIGIAVWLGIYLRDARLRALIPFRRSVKITGGPEAAGATTSGAT